MPYQDPDTELQALWNKRPFIISGPCSAETEEQVLQTARRLKAIDRVTAFRAGIWKPRTRPGNFEGLGVIALPWMQAAKAETGLPLAVEIATAKQVEEALKHDIDILWIGARTTVNPFSVQEVADALKGVPIPVFVKNPVNPDPELWVGAIERVAKAGIEKIGLIHRGFSSYGNTTYRNAPMWHLAIEVRRRFPELMILNDPSHICGRRELLQSVAQKALDLNYDGLMLETHSNPDKAWSDAQQQITPEAFLILLQNLIRRKATIDTSVPFEELEKMRRSIDLLDNEIVQLLGQRMKISEAIGTFKKENNITIFQTERWNEILQRTLEEGLKLGLSEEFVRQYYNAIHMESINHQTKVMNS